MDEAIGSVETILLVTKDENGEEHQTDISKGFSINPNATYGQIDTVSRKLASLTYNTYYDTILITKISVTEKMAE